MPKLAFDAAVFDCDGTLVATRECWQSAYEAVLGLPMDDALMQRLTGASTRIAAARLALECGRAVKAQQIEDGVMRAVGDRHYRRLLASSDY
jgi:beta-phosphoglucomutase-like phosphatase (HAD superfamily)